ncbi:MAG: hypothetical protein WDW38_010766 [Sanguina aurantia]
MSAGAQCRVCFQGSLEVNNGVLLCDACGTQAQHSSTPPEGSSLARRCQSLVEHQSQEDEKGMCVQQQQSCGFRDDMPALQRQLSTSTQGPVGQQQVGKPLCSTGHPVGLPLGRSSHRRPPPPSM